MEIGEKTEFYRGKADSAEGIQIDVGPFPVLKKSDLGIQIGLQKNGKEKDPQIEERLFICTSGASGDKAKSYYGINRCSKMVNH